MTNVYILFGFDETYYNHELAKLLNEHPDVDSIGGIVNRKKYIKFLQEQDEVDYEVLHCITEVHDDLVTCDWDQNRLDEIEEKYGRPSLWPYLVADRRYITYQHDKQRCLLQGWVDFYEKVFDEFEPDLYLAYAVAASHTWLPFVLTQQRGGTSISWKTTRVGNRYALMINNVMDRFTRVDNLFESFKDGRESIQDYKNEVEMVDEFLRSFRQGEDIRPGYYSEGPVRENRSKFRDAIELVAKTADYWKSYNFSQNEVGPDQLYSKPTWKRGVEKLTPTLRKQACDYLDIFEQPVKSDRYVFFPLHLQPEASTSLLAPEYVDQPALVKKISQNLPINTKLYVKEHPSMVGDRSLSYYKEFSNLSNVRLISPEIDSHKLIRDSDLVTTITGTAGLEATFLQKPVLTFGNVHYNKMDMVSQGGDPTSLSENIFRGVSDYTHNEKELRQYLTALFVESFEMPGGGFGRSETTDGQRAEEIYSEIKPLL